MRTLVSRESSIEDGRFYTVLQKVCFLAEKLTSLKEKYNQVWQSVDQKHGH